MKLKNLVNIGGVSLLVNSGWENLKNAGGRELTVSGSCKYVLYLQIPKDWKFKNSKILKNIFCRNFQMVWFKLGCKELYILVWLTPMAW